jgi:4-amino-4-deoxy-L-arabinose transferase-like glycosyltransferase
LLALWLAAGGLLLTALGTPPVTRTQEARVLETAREMLIGEPEQWLVPQVNGRPRMRKPPLAYWLTAGAYRTFGVGEGPGRLPAVIAAWLTVGLTGHLGSRLFGRRAGFFAGATLCGSLLFFRHARLAETDVLAMLFATGATYALWRGAVQWPPGYVAECEPVAAPERPIPRTGKLAGAGWFHVAAIAMALAALAKGPPAAYPMLFFVAWCVVERDARPAWRFFASGAPLTFLAVALPWFAYTASHPASVQLLRDLGNSVEGGKGHWDWPYVYVYELALATAPWTAFVAIALVAAWRRWRGDWRVRGLLVWGVVILAPLCFWGNKQRHYLLPLLPPLMVLVGWSLQAALTAASNTPLARATRAAAAGTLVACALGVPGVLLAGVLVRGRLNGPDLALAGVIAAGLALAYVVRRRRGVAEGAVMFGIANVGVLYVAVVLWGPTLTPVTSHFIANQILSRYGPDAPLVFVGREHLPIVFHLKRIIPLARTDAELAAALARHPKLVGIDVVSKGRPPRTAMLAEEMRFDDGDETDYVVGPLISAGPPPPSGTPAHASPPGDE